MKQTLHSPLSRLLREVHAACTTSVATGVPIDEVLEIRAARRASLPRRAVLLGAAAATAAWRPRPARATSAPRVVIVGAGLAGLACARSLWLQRGIAASIYEWGNEIGGRVSTLRGYFADGVIGEQHGEFISSEHTRMRRLAATYGLALANADAHEGQNSVDTAWFNSQRYTEAALAADWQSYAWRLFHHAVRVAPSANYLHADPRARAWDHMSVTDWVARFLPGGTESPLGALCLANVIDEFGGPPEQQSALNLIYILGFDASSASGYQPRQEPLLAGSDEKYQVSGGNDQIIFGMAGDLPGGAINLGYQLVEVRGLSDGTYRCSFATGGSTVEVAADHVVLTLPPTTLRDVRLANISLTPPQHRALRDATLGTNAKIYLQVAGRPWLAGGYDGTLMTDAAVCGGWDAGNIQPGGRRAGLFAGFPGGTAGATLAARYGLADGDFSQPAPAALVTDTLAQLEPAFPGMTAAWQAGPQKAWVTDGNINPRLRGAYSYFKIGQYTSFAGAQSLRAGNLHFAGEHTSTEFQGYMEGAVQSGYRAAGEI
ncbi:MAG: FAD-dependent oxidoreductase [Rhodospirillales bacterium]